MRRMRIRTRGDDGQQALLLVLGIAVIMVLFSLVLVTSVDQQTPEVNNTLIGHDAYRALQAGVSEFIYGVNQDPNAAACAGIPVTPVTTPETYTPSPSCNYFTSQNVSLDSWQLIPNQPTAGGSANYNPTEWVSIGYPVLNQANQYVQLTVVGAAGFSNAPHSIQYQTANITLDATNDFLLNVSWSNYNAIDTPALDTQLASLAKSGQGCTYLWSAGGDPNCTGSPLLGSGSYAPDFPAYGPIYSNDEVLTTGCPPLTQVVTAAPQITYPNSGCTGGQGAIFPSGAKNVANHANEPIPTTLAAGSDLSNAAKAGGCYYTGPTTITLVGTSGFQATSPSTALNGSGTDAYSLASDTSTCPVNGASATLPTNGVIYVDTVPGACSAAASVNPLTAVYNGQKFSDGKESNTFAGEGSAPGCEGDVILNGSLSGALTIATANNIVIDGNITYADCPITTAELNTMNGSPIPGAWPTGTWAGACNITGTGTNDVLGLIANQYVEMNLPLYAGGSQNGTPYGLCPTNSPAINCTIENPVIMGSILALTHAFAVPNFDEVNTFVGEIDYYGSLAENFIDVEQDGFNGPGYGMDYNWDPRLSVLSPPRYLTPGTNSWVTQSFSVTLGQCSSVWPVNSTTCPTTASGGASVP
jgi:hypothetical protein